MNPFGYIGESLPWWPQYLALVIMFLGLHWPLIRRWSVGVYDPLFALLVANVFSWAIVWFMYLRSDIATVYFVSFTASQVAFYIGIGIGHSGPRAKRSVLLPSAAVSRATPKLILILAGAAHIGATLSIWTLAGIPLFRATRLGAFEGSGGLGILERIADSTGLILVFSLVYLFIHLRKPRRSVLLIVLLLWYFAATALSGSKGAILNLVQYVLSIAFIYTGLRRQPDRFWGGRSGKIFIVGAIVFAIAVLAVQQDSDLTAAVLALAYRIVSYGDVYIFAYPDATIEAIKGDNPLVSMFGGFLSTFRLFPQTLVYPNIGYQFTDIIFPDLDLIVGPNPQHPIFGYHYFGALAFLFSFALGLITGRLHTRMYQRSHRTFISGLFSFMLFFSLVGLGVDFEYSLSRLASMLIGLVVVVGPALLIRPRTPIARMHRGSNIAPRGLVA